MRNKFTLTATGNDGFRHRYEVKKDKYFKKAFEKFMLFLGFEKSVKKIFTDSFEGEEEFEQIYVSLEPKDIPDKVFDFRNDIYECEVFFGNEKVIFVIRTKEHNKIADYLEAHNWISEEEAKNIKLEYNKWLKELHKNRNNEKENKILKEEIKK